MPLSIAGVALLGWWGLGIAPAAALLLGAALAPTDPVLASDVQVEGPSVEQDAEEIDEEDEVRFALTSEAGLNDGLAFPFLYAAVFLALGPVSEWGWRWIGWAGRQDPPRRRRRRRGGLALGRIAFRSRAQSLRVAETGEPLLALAAVLLAYGASEVVGGYGFLAVFACAMTIRSAERSHDYHALMHQVIERLERLLTLIVLLFVGIGLTHGLLSNLDWRGLVIGVALVFVIRPLAGSWRSRSAASGGPWPGLSSTGTSGSSPRSSGSAGSVRSTTRLRPRTRVLPRGAVAVVDRRLHHRAVGRRPRDRRDPRHASPGAAARRRRRGVAWRP